MTMHTNWSSDCLANVPPTIYFKRISSDPTSNFVASSKIKILFPKFILCSHTTHTKRLGWLPKLEAVLGTVRRYKIQLMELQVMLTPVSVLHSLSAKFIYAQCDLIPGVVLGHI